MTLQANNASAQVGSCFTLSPAPPSYQGPPNLSEMTTLRVGGDVANSVDAESAEEMVEVIRRADAAGLPLLVLAGGSNLVPGDGDFPGTVVRPLFSEVRVTDADSCGGTSVEVDAGAQWDAFVALAVAQEWIGVEALSGIPGSVGATPVQNVGAYGQEVASAIASVRTWDRSEDRYRTFASADLGFSYRDSLLKQSMTREWMPTPRYVVLSVSFQFLQGGLSEPVRYQELARKLEMPVGQRAPMADVRSAVLDLRVSKGMVLDEQDRDTWSAGSFFTNPIISESEAARLPAEAPRFPAGYDAQGRPMIKTSAAWLISHAGIERGWSLGRGARVSSKHSLALTNTGGATAADILELARAVRGRVEREFGILLRPEPILMDGRL